MLGLTPAEIGRLADGRGDLMGPLDGVRVVELTHEHVAWAGKLLADLGADVVVVEPPGGSPQRSFEPFLDDEPGPERSLWWWHYNTSKRSVVADLAADRERDRWRCVADADVFIEGEAPGTLAAARARLGDAVGAQPAAGDGVDHAVRQHVGPRRTSRSPT